MMNEEERRQNEQDPSGTAPGRSGTAASSSERFQHAREAAHDKVEDVRARADSAKQQAVDRIRRIGSALRAAGDGLHDDEALAGYARKASDRVDGVAEYLSVADGRQLVRDTEDFARRKPAVFFGGAFLLGLAAARFLRSSGIESQEPLPSEDAESGREEVVAITRTEVVV